MFRKLKILFIITCIYNLSPASDRISIGVGILLDQENIHVSPVLAQLKQEVERLVGAQYQVQFNKELILNSNGVEAEFTQQYKQLLQNDQVQIILGFGVFTSTFLAKQAPFNKATITVGVFDPLLQGIQFPTDNKSGISNFTYVWFNQSLDKDLQYFQSVFPFKKLGFVFHGPTLKLMAPYLKRVNSKVSEQGFEVMPIPSKSSISDLLEQSADYDAIYLGFLGSLEGNEKKKLIETLTEKGIPVFVSSKKELEWGALVAKAPEEDFLKMVRRVALNIESIIRGTNPAELPVTLKFEEKKYINLSAAKKLGFSPDFNILSSSEIISIEEEESATTLTFNDVIRIGLQSNLSIIARALDVDISEQETRGVRAKLFPTVALGARATQIDRDRAENSFGSQAERMSTASVSFSQVLFSDKLNRGYKSSQFSHMANQQAYDSSRLDLIQQLAEAYVTILQSHTAVNVFRENVALNRKHLSIASNRQMVGYSGAADVYRWQSQLESSFTDLLESQNNLETAKMNLNFLLNRPLDEAVFTTLGDIESTILKNYPGRKIKYLIRNEAILKRYMAFQGKEAVALAPEIRQLEKTIQALQQNLQGLRRERIIPTVSFAADINETLSKGGAGSTASSSLSGIDPADDTTWSANLNFSLPVFQGGIVKTNIAKSNLQITQLQHQKSYLIQQVNLRVRSALLNLVTLSVNREKSKISADLAEKSLLLVQDSYAKGKASVTELADAQNIWVNADLNALNSGYRFLSGLFQMERAIGRFFVLMPELEKNEYTQRVIAELGQD